MLAKETIFSVCIASLIPSWSSAQEGKEPVPVSGKPIKREQLRFEGRTFEQWQAELLTELSADRRVKALSALQRFAANGYAAEAAAAVMETMGAYDIEGMPSEENDGEVRKKEAARVASVANGVLDVAGEAANPVLVRALESGQRNRRIYALERLRWWPEERDMHFAIAALGKLGTDRDASTRESAIQLLVSRWQTKGAAEAIARVLEEGDSKFALDLMESSKMDAGPLIAEIEKLTSHKTNELRSSAINVLAAHLENKGAKEAMKRVLQQGDRDLALYAIQKSNAALGSLVGVIEGFARKADMETQQLAVMTLAKRVRCEGAAPALSRLFKEGNEAFRLTIINSLGPDVTDSEAVRLNGPYLVTSALPVSLLAFSDPSAKVRGAGVQAVSLFRTGGESEKLIQPALARLLIDPDAEVSKLAYIALWRRTNSIVSGVEGVPPPKTPFAVPELTAIVRRQEFPARVRIRAINLLLTNEADSKEVVAAVEEAAKDKDSGVKKEAEEFLAWRKQRLERQRNDE